MKTIVAGLALDGSDEPVVARAAQLAGQHGAKLTLVHAIETMPPGDAGGLDTDAVKALLERDAADRLAAHMPSAIRHDIVVAEGRPFEVICDLARRRHADLVVIGPGKAKTLREKVLGSTADRVVRSAPVPVLVVRLDIAGPYRRVTVAADLSPQSLSASRAARALAPQAAIEHVHVVDMPLSFEQALLRAGTPTSEVERYRRARHATARSQNRAIFAGAEPLKLRLLQGDARTLMARQATGRRTDLVALGAHGRGVAAQLLLGSVAHTVLRSATCDVLLVPR